MSNGTIEPRSVSVAVLNAVRMPLTFFTLVLLVTEAALGAVALRPDANGLLVLIVAVGVFLIVTAVVAFLAFRAPGALTGVDWLRESLADSLAEAVVSGLSPSVDNLESNDDRITVWVDLIVWSKRQLSDATLPERKFRDFFARGIRDRVVKKTPALRQAIEQELKVAEMG